MADPSPRILFGGPDLPPRLLRNELEARVKAVPPGGQIAWSTYYFRDRALAQALIDACERGVDVVLRVEGAPRHPEVNEQVLAMLEKHGLEDGLKVHRPPKRLFERRYPYWHSKIYCFSHPTPAVLIGSFNPSGDDPENAEIIAAIGDQDRGHNLLVEYFGEKAFRSLRDHVRRTGRWWPRFDPMQNLRARFGSSTIWKYPRISRKIIEKQLKLLGPGDRTWGAISHLKHGELATELAAAAQRGALVDLLLHDTDRRVPEKMVEELTRAGVSARRYVHSQELPLHLKFLVIEIDRRAQAWFGSFNFNKRSYYYNHEVLVDSRDPAIIEALERRYAHVAAEVERQSG